MNKNQNKKKSLTRTLTFKLSLMLVVVLAALLVSSYIMASEVVREQELRYNRRVANEYLNAISDYATRLNVPIDENCKAYLENLGDMYCTENYAAFIFIYVVGEDREHIKVLNVSEVEGIGFIESLPVDDFSVALEYLPDDDELELWNGERDYIDYDDMLFKDAVVSAVASDDDFGNRIVVGSAVSFQEVYRDIASNFSKITLLILVFFVLLTIGMYHIIVKNVLRPARKISDFMAAYIKDGIRTVEKLEESGSYEFDIISSSLNVMTENIDSYIENIKDLNNVQAANKAELDIASGIQKGFLAANHLYAKDCEIYASMEPAKNVGGDLYDYIVLDDGKIFMAVADISGKGISASMYMAVTLIIMKLSARRGIGPAAILEYTNRVISANNPNMLFATAFVGIYNPDTRELTYSNAGHLPPFLIKDKPEILNGAKNLVLGLYGDEKYTEETIKLDYGDIVFLYTDGVTDAINEEKNFFGEERLQSALNDFLISREDNIVEYVDGKITEFMNNAEPFDDLTMLSCTVKHRTVLELPPDEREFDKIKGAILSSGLEHSLKLSLILAAEEIFINICSYAFLGKSPDEDKTINFIFEHSDRIFIKFEDNGMEYDPTKNVDMDIDYDPDEQIGGLGKIIAFTIADKIQYEYTDNKNILTMIKYLREV